MFLSFDSLRKSPETIEIRELYHLLINIEATLKISEGTTVKLEIPMITIVELASSLWEWQSYRPSQNFSFDSIDDDEKEIFQVIRNEEKWRVHSVWETEEIVTEFTSEQIESECRGFITDVIRRTKEELGVDCRKFGLFNNF